MTQCTACCYSYNYKNYTLLIIVLQQVREIIRTSVRYPNVTSFHQMVKSQSSW